MQTFFDMYTINQVDISYFNQYTNSATCQNANKTTKFLDNY